MSFKKISLILTGICSAFLPAIASFSFASNFNISNQANNENLSINNKVNDILQATEPLVFNDWKLQSTGTTGTLYYPNNAIDLIGKKFYVNIYSGKFRAVQSEPTVDYVLDFSDFDKMTGLEDGTGLIANAPFASSTHLVGFICPKNDNFTYVGKYFFYRCNSLKFVYFPANNVTHIGDSAFRYLQSLQYVNIPSSVTEMGTTVFEQPTSSNYKNMQVVLNWNSPSDVTVTSTNYSLGVTRKVFYFQTPEIRDAFVSDSLWKNLSRYMVSVNPPSEVTINGPDALSSIPNKGGSVTYSATASPSTSNTSVIYELIKAPIGVFIDSTSGVLTWSEKLASGSYDFQVRAASIADRDVFGILNINLTIDPDIPTDVTISGNASINASYKTSGTSQYNATILPESANQQVAWSIDSITPQTNQITINSAGLLSWTDNLPMNTYHLKIKAASVINNSIFATQDVLLKIEAVNPTSLTINGDANLQGTKNHEGSSQYTISAAPNNANDTVIWTLEDAPGGISINNDGLLEYNNSLAVGSYHFTIKATSLVANDIVATKDITLVINETFPTALTINGQGTLTTNNKTSGSSQYTVTASPSDASNKVLWNIATTPITNEISINANGLLEWSKNITSGIYNITLTAISSVASSIRATKNVTLNVNEVLPDAILVSGQSSIKALYGQANSSQYTATTSPENATSDVTWSMTSSQPSSEITIDQNGLLTWTDQAPVGTFLLTIKATSKLASSIVGTKAVTLDISRANPTSVVITGLDTLNGTLGTSGQSSYNANILPDNADQSVSWSLESNTQGNKISISQSGVLSWTNDLAVGTYNFTIKATSAFSPNISQEKNVTLIIHTTLTDFKIDDTNQTMITGYFKQSGSLTYNVTANAGADTSCEWSLIDAPSGVSIDVKTGVLTWDNTLAINTYSFSIQATSVVDSQFTDTINVTLEIIESPSDNTTTYIIIGAAVGLVVLMIIIGAIIYDQKRRKRQKSS